jgi:hypothetical protein
MTPECVQRSNDEKLYQPRIHSRWIRELYRMKEDTGDPMTVLIDQALAEFVERRRSEPQQGTSDEPTPVSLA